MSASDSHTPPDARVRELEAENARLRRLLADVVEGEDAEEGTPQWYALRNAREALEAGER